jgi:sialate O-acetylesterase
MLRKIADALMCHVSLLGCLGMLRAVGTHYFYAMLISPTQSTPRFSTQNMAYGLGGHMAVNDSRTEVADMVNYPNIRLYQVGNRGSTNPEIEVSNTTQGWSEPCSIDDKNKTTCRYGFSAVCWLYARAIFEKLDPPRPLGLIETNVGGTPDEHWSSPDALNKCYGPGGGGHGRPKIDSVLWNGMVVPLLNSTIYGVAWYQGEQNSGRPGGQSGYNCTFPAMIDDWRAKWHEGTGGQTASQFPFGFVQLNGNGNGDTFNNPLDDGLGVSGLQV